MEIRYRFPWKKLQMACVRFTVLGSRLDVASSTWVVRNSKEQQRLNDLANRSQEFLRE